MQHRVILTVNLGTLAENYRAVCGVAAPCAVMPVLKANAYGLGVDPIAKALVAAGAPRIAVAEPFEALALADLGVPIQILSGILPDEIGPMIEAGVTLPLVSLESARAISDEAVRQGRTAICHLAFRVVLDAAEALGHRFRWVHAANSDAINNAPAACAAPFNLVRCGINLHGAFDAAGSLRVPLRPVLTMTTRLAQIRDLPEGTPIGYGHTYRTRRPMRVGTVCAGYADGLPLALSNRGSVLIRGVPVPILGRLSMDYLTVNLDDVPEACVGDVVTLLGRDGDHEIPVQDWAALKGTHAYDIICSIGSRVARRYQS